MKLSDILEKYVIDENTVEIILDLTTDEFDECVGARSDDELNDLINEYGDLEVKSYDISEYTESVDYIPWSYDLHDPSAPYTDVDETTVTVKVIA